MATQSYSHARVRLCGWARARSCSFRKRWRTGDRYQRRLLTTGTRVQGELIRLGHRIAASTVWQILHDAGIDPAPGRSVPTWRQFLTAQAKAVLAVDFVQVNAS